MRHKTLAYYIITHHKLLTEIMLTETQLDLYQDILRFGQPEGTRARDLIPGYFSTVRGASAALNRLFLKGYLTRHSVRLASGGREYVYTSKIFEEPQ